MTRHQKESYEYQDEGCDTAPSCLLCPLPDCKYGNDKSHPRFEVQLYSQQIIGLRNQGKTALELAKEFNLSKKTIYRILKHPI